MTDSTATDLLDISQLDVLTKSRVPNNLRNFQQKAFQDRLDGFEKILKETSSSQQLELLIANQNRLDLEQTKILNTLNQLVTTNNQTLKLLEEINTTILDTIANSSSKTSQNLSEINDAIANNLSAFLAKSEVVPNKQSATVVNKTSNSSTRTPTRNTTSSRSSTRPAVLKDEFIRGDEIYEE